jgi:hypothetical protein
MSSPPTPSKPKNSEQPKLLTLGRKIPMIKILCQPDHMSRWAYVDRFSMVELLRQAGIPHDLAYRLYEEGPEEIHWYLVDNPHLVVSEWVTSVVAPKKTWTNKIGEFFSTGTTCVCCLGWRVGLALLGWPVFFFLGVLYERI